MIIQFPRISKPGQEVIYQPKGYNPTDFDLPEAITSTPELIPPHDIESQCGLTNESQDVESYNGGLGVTAAFVNQHQGPVGQHLLVNPGGTVTRWCSGTLIGADLFLSAGHCSIATTDLVSFNYQRDPAGNLRPEQRFPVLAVLEDRLGGLDYIICQLGGNPGNIFGITQISAQDANVGDMTAVIGHPAGLPKQVEAGPVLALNGDQIRYNDTDTLPGNSGSGVLHGPTGQIVGVHTNGGCSGTQPETGFNLGVRISSILGVSPILQNLIAGAGEGLFASTDGSGNIATLAQHTTWDRDWDLIIPGDFGGGGTTDLLFYKRSAGEGLFASTDGSGNIATLAQHTTWDRDWNLIIPGDFGGGGTTDLLFYKRSAGEGLFASTDGSGNIATLAQHTTWDRDWDLIIPGDFGGGGTTDLLFYKRSAGEGLFASTDGSGNIATLAQHTTWDRDWNLIIPGDFGGGGTTDLLFYKRSAGEGLFASTDGSGNIATLAQHTTWDRDWNLIIPGNFDANGFTDLLFYKG